MISGSLHLLDTNTVSYIVRQQHPSVRRLYLETERHSPIAISAITEAEIRFGLEKRPGARQIRSTFDFYFEGANILPWNSDAAKAYARLRAGLNAVGKSLDTMDMLIAAHAIATGAILVSHDKAFRQLSPMLSVVDWAEDL